MIAGCKCYANNNCNSNMISKCAGQGAASALTPPPHFFETTPCQAKQKSCIILPYTIIVVLMIGHCLSIVCFVSLLINVTCKI